MALVAPREVVRDSLQRLAPHLRLLHRWSRASPQRLELHLRLRHYWSQERLQRLVTRFRLCPRPWTGC